MLSKIVCKKENLKYTYFYRFYTFSRKGIPFVIQKLLYGKDWKTSTLNLDGASNTTIFLGTGKVRKETALPFTYYTQTGCIKILE